MEFSQIFVLVTYRRFSIFRSLTIIYCVVELNVWEAPNCCSVTHPANKERAREARRTIFQCSLSFWLRLWSPPPNMWLLSCYMLHFARRVYIVVLCLSLITSCMCWCLVMCRWSLIFKPKHLEDDKTVSPVVSSVHRCPTCVWASCFLQI